MTAKQQLCLRCKKPFTLNRYWQKYCSQKCRQATWFEKNFQRIELRADDIAKLPESMLAMADRLKAISEDPEAMENLSDEMKLYGQQLEAALRATAGEGRK
jgi:hypothetical protein